MRQRFGIEIRNPRKTSAVTKTATTTPTRSHSYAPSSVMRIATSSNATSRIFLVERHY